MHGDKIVTGYLLFIMNTPSKFLISNITSSTLNPPIPNMVIWLYMDELK